MRRSLRAIVVWLLIARLISSADVVNAGPFHDFFASLRSAIAHPHDRRRPHRSSRSSQKHTEIPPTDAPTSQISSRPVPSPPSSPEIHGEGGLERESSKNRLAVWNSRAGKTGPSFQSVRARERLRRRLWFSAGKRSRRPVHGENFPYAVGS